jgi:hypothetical protein
VYFDTDDQKPYIYNGSAFVLFGPALTDLTSTTSSTVAASATAVKAAYDLANAAVAKSTVTTAGDIIYATGSAAVTRLGIGSTNNILTAGASAPAYQTLSALHGAVATVPSQAAGDLVYASSGTALGRLGIGAANTVLTSSGSAPQWSTQSGMALISSTTLASATQTFTISSIPSTYKSLLVYSYNIKSSTATAANLSVQMNGLSTTTYGRKGITVTSASTTVGTSAATTGDTSWAVDLASGGVVISGAGAGSVLKMEFPNYAASMYKAALWTFMFGTAASSMAPGFQIGFGFNSTTAAVSSISLVSSSATNLIGAGAVIEIYGVY